MKNRYFIMANMSHPPRHPAATIVLSLPSEPQCMQLTRPGIVIECWLGSAALLLKAIVQKVDKGTSQLGSLVRLLSYLVVIRAFVCTQNHKSTLVLSFLSILNSSWYCDREFVCRKGWKEFRTQRYCFMVLANYVNRWRKMSVCLCLPMHWTSP